MSDSDSMPQTATRFRINGADLQADPSGAAFWPAESTLIVADLHLGKGASLARRGSLLPPYDTVATLIELKRAIERLQPRRVICLGDSFHDRHAAASLPRESRATLLRLAKGRRWIWIAGNHDPDPPADCGGELAEEIVVGGLVFRHEARDPRSIHPSHAAGEVSGHFHPKASVRLRGRRITRRCFVEDGRRLVMPSFGAYTGGLDVLTPNISALFPKGFVVRMLGRETVHAYARAALSPIASG